MSINSAHSFYEKNSEFVDERLFEFLIKFHAKGYMKDTIIQLYSDHGDHLHVLLEYTESGMMEKTHPPLFMIIPEAVAD
jgi:phosphoglycerol transferase MdoB-like AlkP superfamily enzyme